MDRLTSPTMAELARKRFLSAQLIFHPSAMTATFVEGAEIAILVYFIRLAEFPVVVLAVDVSGGVPV